MLPYLLLMLPSMILNSATNILFVTSLACGEVNAVIDGMYSTTTGNEPLPSRMTSSLASAIWSRPASATGGSSVTTVLPPVIPAS